MRSKKNQKIIVRAIDPNTPKMHVEWQKITQTPPKTSITMTEVAENVATAYREYRKMQHALKLQGVTHMRVEISLVGNYVAVVNAFWRLIFTS